MTISTNCQFDGFPIPDRAYFYDRIGKVPAESTFTLPIVTALLRNISRRPISKLLQNIVQIEVLARYSNFLEE